MTQNNKTVIIPQWAIDLISFEGYVKRFLFHAQTTKTYKAAYLKTEDEYYQFFSNNRFKSYNSFNTARYRRRKRIKAKKAKLRNTAKK